MLGLYIKGYYHRQQVMVQFKLVPYDVKVEL
jgi:hypothetical protein